MDAGNVSGWWVVAAVATPIAFDLAVEPWRIPTFIFFCVWFGFFAFLLRTAAQNDWNK